MKALIPAERIENRIFIMRGQRIMVDRDLAELYGVETKYLNRQVRRNIERFPAAFMFRLNVREKNELVTICHRFESMKHSSSLPYAFTEHGVAMLASVLNSKRAIKISIFIVEVFVRLRNFLSTHKELAHKLVQIERKIKDHDGEIRTLFEAIRQLMAPLVEKKEYKIGFRPHDN